MSPAPPPLTPTQARVALVLASGNTISTASELYDVPRVTIYRWLRTNKTFQAVVSMARTEFAIAIHDDLKHLCDRALQSLRALFDNPRTPPSVRLRAAIFVLERPQAPNIGWTIPDPVPEPGKATSALDSARIEQNYHGLPYLQAIDRGENQLFLAPLYTPTSLDATSCNQTQHVSQIFRLPPARFDSRLANRGRNPLDYARGPAKLSSRVRLNPFSLPP